MSTGAEIQNPYVEGVNLIVKVTDPSTISLFGEGRYVNSQKRCTEAVFRLKPQIMVSFFHITVDSGDDTVTFTRAYKFSEIK